LKNILKKYAIQPYFFILPAFVFLGLFTYWPIIKTVYYSFFKWNLSTPHKIFVGLGTYAATLEDPLTWKVLANTFQLGIETIVPTIALSMYLAILLNRSIRWISLARLCFYYPSVLPTVAVGTIWIFLLLPGYGLIPHYLGKFGLSELRFLSNSYLALHALAFVSVWKQAGYFMIFFLAGLQAISAELYEAAALEGASRWQRFRFITLPLLRPITLFVLVMALIGSVQFVDQVFVMTPAGGPLNSTNILLFHIYQAAFQYWNLGEAAVLTVFQVLILVSVSLLAFRVLERGTHYE